MRAMQGLALGGEYGGAATYIASTRLTASAPLHLMDSDHRDVGHRAGAGGDPDLPAVDERAGFRAWGWRIPFLISAVLVALSSTSA